MKSFILILSVIISSSQLLHAQPKDGEAGSKGSYKPMGFASVLDDSAAVKQGHYELYYEGVKIVSGHYTDNEKDGLWKYTNITGDILIQGLYSKNKKTGAWKYFVNQKPLSTIYYKNDEKDSTWQSYYENGKIQCISNYTNGLKNGMFKLFYTNGMICTDANYKNDTIIGNYITYYKDSIVKTNVEYRNGLPFNVIAMNDSLGNPIDFGSFKNGTGLLKRYFVNGKIDAEINFEKGTKNGLTISYDKGVLSSKGAYRNGRRIGKWTYYNSMGAESWSTVYTEEDVKSDSLKNEFKSVAIDLMIMSEVMPKAQGAEKGMMLYIIKNIIYPDKSKENGISGTVYVTYVVSVDGSLRDIRVLRGVAPEINREAIRVVNEMPPWTPGFQNGFPVDVQFNLPIKFTLR